jgi:hypothetical protein
MNTERQQFAIPRNGLLGEINMTKYKDNKRSAAKRTQQIRKPSKKTVGVNFMFMDVMCTRWFQPDGSLSVVGPSHATGIIEPYENMINGLLKEEAILQLIKAIESEGMHDAIMIKHAYIEVLTDRCMKLAKAGLIDQWPHVSEQDVRNVLAGGYSPVVAQKRELSKIKNRLPTLSPEQERALLLLDKAQDGCLTEEQLLAYGITKETLDSLT